MVAPSRWLAERVKSSSLFAKSRIEVIPNGVDANWYSPGIRCQEKEKLGFPIDRHLVLFGGKNSLHDNNKGFDLLFLALRTLPDKIRKNSDVVVFGDREDWQFPDCDIKIHNLGVVTDEAFLVTIYRAADVLVLPSRQENLPNVLLEAMSCGTPCVAFDIGGVGEIIDNNVTGYVCKPYEIGEMSAAIASIVSDQTLKDDFSDKCRAKIMRDFALDIVTSRYLGLYSELHV
jgi:glycosyltransferase involved in cell wall biosynthesis